MIKKDNKASLIGRFARARQHHIHDDWAAAVLARFNGRSEPWLDDIELPFH